MPKGRMIPPEEDFDPMTIISDCDNKLWPYSFSAPSQIEIQRLHKPGSILQFDLPDVRWARRELVNRGLPRTVRGSCSLSRTDDESAAIGEHFNYLERLVAADVVLVAGRTLNADADTFRIVIFNAASEAEAMDIMQNDPAIKKGVMKAELFPYQIELWSHRGPPAE